MKAKEVIPMTMRKLSHSVQCFTSRWDSTLLITSTKPKQKQNWKNSRCRWTHWYILETFIFAFCSTLHWCNNLRPCWALIVYLDNYIETFCHIVNECNCTDISRDLPILQLFILFPNENTNCHTLIYIYFKVEGYAINSPFRFIS